MKQMTSLYYDYEEPCYDYITDNIKLYSRHFEDSESEESKESEIKPNEGSYDCMSDVESKVQNPMKTPLFDTSALNSRAETTLPESMPPTVQNILEQPTSETVTEEF